MRYGSTVILGLQLLRFPRSDAIYCCTFSQIDDVSQQLHETEDTLQKAMREAYRNMSAQVSKLQDSTMAMP